MALWQLDTHMTINLWIFCEYIHSIVIYADYYDNFGASNETQMLGKSETRSENRAYINDWENYQKYVLSYNLDIVSSTHACWSRMANGRTLLISSWLFIYPFLLA